MPLPALALAQLPVRPDPADPTARTMVFGRRHHMGYSGWGKAKDELDAAINAVRIGGVAALASKHTSKDVPAQTTQVQPDTRRNTRPAGSSSPG